VGEWVGGEREIKNEFLVTVSARLMIGTAISPSAPRVSLSVYENILYICVCLCVGICVASTLIFP
jgi:hypothetical protein